MIEFLSLNPGAFLFIVILIFIFYNRFKKKKDDSLKINVQQQVKRQASAAGLQVTSLADGHWSVSGEIHGDTEYNGTTGEIQWTLRSTVLVADRGEDRNKVWNRKSMWRTQAVKLPAGKFILLMSIPGEIKMGNIKRGGFLNSLVNKAADAVLDIYVAGYFGSEYKSLVNIGEDGVKIEREGLKDFMILTNIEPLAQQYFDEATVSTISLWKKSNQGFTLEDKVDQFGLLFSPDGVILTCRANMGNAGEVKLFSDFGAVLTT